MTYRIRLTTGGGLTLLARERDCDLATALHVAAGAMATYDDERNACTVDHVYTPSLKTLVVRVFEAHRMAGGWFDRASLQAEVGAPNPRKEPPVAPVPVDRKRSKRASAAAARKRATRA